MSEPVLNRRLFRPGQTDPYPVSRSKLELFLECPRCFFLDRRYGIGRPGDMPFSLNLAVDALMKKEFDFYRLRNEPHPVMNAYGIEAVPYRHPDLATWRDTPTGIRVLHGRTNLELFGLIDDIWAHPDGSLSVVDYKATSTAATITLDERHGYKRQLDVYRWLFVQNGFEMNSTGYFVFVNASRDRDMFDRSLEFVMQVLPHACDDAWIEDALIGVKECLMSDTAPPSTADCDWCAYRREARTMEII